MQSTKGTTSPNETGSEVKPLNQKLLQKTDTYSRETDEEYYARGNTFSRAFTFDPLALKRTLTQTLGIDADLDEKWTNDVVSTFEIAAKQKDGDIPEPAAYGREREFWINFFLTGCVGVLLGLAGIVYLNATEKGPKWWANNFEGGDTSETYFHCDTTCNYLETKTAAFTNNTSCECTKYKNFDLYAGKTYWIAITTCTGFVVGLIRHLTKYPEDLPGIFKEILDYHVHWEWSFLTFLISTISLAGGACLGPEQALGNVGGGLASYISEKWLHFEKPENRNLFVLGGIASALGALMPSPLLAVILVHELGEIPKSFMESTLIMGFGATMGFMVYYSLIKYTWLEEMSVQTAYISVYDWTFEETNCMTAIVIGMVSAALGLCCLLIIGVTKQFLNRIRLRLEQRNLMAARTILPTTIAGLIIGLINWTLPMTIGNGSQTMSMIVSYGLKGQLDKSLLIKSAFAKIFCLGLSMNGGFVGGFVFPIMTVGSMAGVVANIMYPSLPIGLTCGCFIAAVPCSICPIPFTFTILITYVFYMGAYQAAPIFIACITSYTLVVGSGIFNLLRRRAAQSANKGDPPKPETSAEKQKKEQENFAVEQYMATQKNKPLYA